MRREKDWSRMVQRRKDVATGVVIEGLRSIEERIEGLLETYEIMSDEELLGEIRESLKEAEKGRGRSIKEIIADLGKAKTT